MAPRLGSPTAGREVAKDATPAPKKDIHIAGTVNGHFFGGVPAYVDKTKKPGYSGVPQPTLWDWIKTGVTLKHIWGAPNAVWLIIALAIHFLAPLDLSSTGTAAAGPMTWAFFRERAPLWLAIVHGYTAFWHASLYGFGCSKRPFVAGRKYNFDKVAHNIFWSTSGILIWTACENVFAFLWATGRLEYMSDAQAAASSYGLLKFIAAAVVIPLWRDFHFYFAHRLLHFAPLYAVCHSLHHRNQDIEPFAGLSMHPVEHLYYYSCFLPSLIPGCSPFFFLWNGVHLLLAPGASHSGWEDHFQADFFHYAHHRYFEVNYAGLGASFLDVAFGSFLGSFAEREQDKTGEKGGPSQPEDAKSTLRGLPTGDFLAYLALAGACVAAWAIPACFPPVWAALKAAAPWVTPLHLGVLAGFGPVAVAMPWFNKAGGTRWSAKHAPVMHWAVGSVFCSFPVAAAAAMCF